jgi:hypothetical protein
MYANVCKSCVLQLCSPSIQLGIELLEEKLRMIQGEIKTISLAVVDNHSAKTIFLDGSGLQMTLALGVLYEHLKQIVVDKPHRHRFMLDLVVIELKKNLPADTSQLTTGELLHKRTRSKSLQSRRPTQPIVVQWKLADEPLGDHSIQSEEEWQLKGLSVADEIEFVLNLPIGKARICLAMQRSLVITRNASFGTRLFFLPHRRLMIEGVSAPMIPGLALMISSLSNAGNLPYLGTCLVEISKGYNRLSQKVQLFPTIVMNMAGPLIWVRVVILIISYTLITLQYALFYYDCEMIELLLREGADPFDCDSEGGNALVCFIENVWPRKRIERLSASGAESLLSTTRRLLHVCGADTARLTHW